MLDNIRKFSSRRSTLNESAPQGEIITVMQNFLQHFFLAFLPINIMRLTILSDKSNATVDYNGDTVFRQLLVAECLAISASSQCDGRVPQCKVHLVEAVDVNCSIKKKKKKRKKIIINEACLDIISSNDIHI